MHREPEVECPGQTRQVLDLSQPSPIMRIANHDLNGFQAHSLREVRKRGHRHIAGQRRSLPLLRKLSSGLSNILQTGSGIFRSEDHTSELQSHSDLVCRLLLEKKKKNILNLISRL